MNRRRFVTASCSCAAIPGFAEEAAISAEIVVELDAETPGASRGRIVRTGSTFPVGLGKHGFLPAGRSFRGGYSLLGLFSVSAILSGDRFQMTEKLISESGKSRDWLAENLFRNMSSIDFDGDGVGGEYGGAFIGLEPLDSTAKQPFHFGEYKGVFRWYSYAIHGTQDESRVGKCVTGGCINVRKTDLVAILDSIGLGDRVAIRAV